MGNIKKISFLLLVLSLSFQAQAQRCGAHIIKGDLDISYKGTADKRFDMNSVMKFPQAIYVAHYLDSCCISLDKRVTVKKQDLEQNTWSPMLKMIDVEREFSYGELLALSLQQSDNNACDLLFKLCGSPRDVQNYLRSLGFKNIRLKWTEKQMHSKPRRSHDNWCTPSDMAELLNWFYCERQSSPVLKYIWDLMFNCETGNNRIKAALPPGAQLAHKTGTGFSKGKTLRGINDVGIVIMPNGDYYPIAIFIKRTKREEEVAEIAKILLSP
ncbi:MAG: class A beta-lactamase [Muribaculaceae bacterium]|nr:class A beta-lactamase [Muribaculaceae bacterium]